MEEVCERKCVCLLNIFFVSFSVNSVASVLSRWSCWLDFAVADDGTVQTFFLIFSIWIAFCSPLSLYPFLCPNSLALSLSVSLTLSISLPLLTLRSPLKWKIYRLLLLHRFPSVFRAHDASIWISVYRTYNSIWFCDSIQSSKVPADLHWSLFIFFDCTP